jgi:putative cell wall-binding protein/glucose/arabinose dehydrogenase
MATVVAPFAPGVAAPAAATYQVQLVPVVTSGLTEPVLVTHAGDARLFVVEQGGDIRIVSGGTLLPQPFVDLTPLILKNGSERGLLGLAFHPQYASNGRLFVFYTRAPDGDLQISELRRSAGNANLADPPSTFVREILRIEHSQFGNHNGGMLAFGPDGHLYIATGDGGGGGDPFEAGQDINTRLGKILRIDIDTPSAGIPFEVPPDNPFVGTAGDDLVWSYGLRNPWRFSFDRLTGDLWIGDVGQGAWEEIDRAPRSAGGGRGWNFGWDVLEGRHCFEPSSGCSAAGKVGPIAEYDHGQGCSVTGGHVYRGPVSPALLGRYFFADYCSGRLWDLEAVGGATQTPRLLLSTGLNISSFGEDVNGEVYIVGHGGTIHRIAGIGGPVGRIAGADRYGTAAAISSLIYSPGVPTVVVANGETLADAVSGGPPAAVRGGPILLARAGSIPHPTASELLRLRPASIIVLGGAGVISDGVLNALRGYTTGPVTRIGGADRYGTAAAISAAVYGPGVATVFIASGETLADAVSGGPPAAVRGGPILLVRAGSIPSATANELARLKPASIVVLGGAGVVSDAVVGALRGYTGGPITRVAGADRYGTAAAISSVVYGAGVPTVFIASGETLADAVSGGPPAAVRGGPILLVRAGSIPPATANELRRLQPRSMIVLGGPGVIPTPILNTLQGFTVP